MPDNDNTPFGWGNDEDEKVSLWTEDEEDNSAWGSDDEESAWESDNSDSAWSTEDETDVTVPAENDSPEKLANKKVVTGSAVQVVERDEVYAAMLRSVQSSAKRNKIIKGVVIALIVVAVVGVLGFFAVKFLGNFKERNNSHDISISEESTEEPAEETNMAVTTVTTVQTTTKVTTASIITTAEIDYEKIDEAYNKVLSDFMNSDDYKSYEDYGSMCSMYELYDINSDGIQELFISEGAARNSRVFIYTYTGSECKEVKTLHLTYGTIYVEPKKSFVAYIDSHMGYTFKSLYEFNGNTLDLKESFSDNSMNADYETVVYKHNNQEVTETEYITAMSAYDYLQLIVVGRLNYFEENNDETTDDTNAESPVKIYKDSFCYGMVHVESGGLNLRSEPDTDCKVLEIIPNNTKLYIYYTECENWYYTSYNGKSGYVSAEFISFDFENYSDQEEESYSEDLPVKIHTDVDFPMEFSNYVDGEILCTYKITGIRYNCERIKNTNRYNVILYFSGKKTYSKYNDYVNDTVKIKYEILDSEGKKLDIDLAWYDTPELEVRGTFTNDEETIYNSLEAGEYTLVLS